MRKVILVFVAVLAATPLGCGRKTGPVAATAEEAAEQRRDEKLVQDAESTNAKQRKPGKTQEQQVEEAESARQRRGGR